MFILCVTKKSLLPHIVPQNPLYNNNNNNNNNNQSSSSSFLSHLANQQKSALLVIYYSNERERKKLYLANKKFSCQIIVVYDIKN